MRDEDFVAAFEDGSLAAKEFDHRAHVRLGWLYLREMPMAAAIDRFTAGLKAFTRRCGAEDKYHETITWFYLLLIADRQARCQAHSFGDFIAANPDLVTNTKTMLSRYYRQETLRAQSARSHFVLPDNFAA